MSRFSTKQKLVVAMVCPCFNEVDVIELFHQELSGVLHRISGYAFKIIFIDDGSTDGTLEKLATLSQKDSRVHVLALSRNFGHQTALFAGIENAISDAVITMDSDLQHPPSLIPVMLEAWKNGADVVSTVREATEGASWFKRFSSSIFYRLLNFLSDTKVVPGAADFMLLSEQARQALISLPDRHLFIRGMVSWIGFERVFLPYTAAARVAGKSKYSLGKMISLSLNGIFSFSVKPITLALRIGAGVISVSLLYFLYIAARYVLYGDLVRGWASLATLVLFTGGVQLCFIGLIGQYLGRVFEQVKGRPRYHFKRQVKKLHQQASRVPTRRMAA